MENHDGQELGKLRDLVLDVQSGQVRYALVSAGGFLGLGSHIKVVPAECVSTGTAKRGTLALDVSVRCWKNAPAFRIKELAALGSLDRTKKIYEFCGQVPHNWSSALAREKPESEPHPPPVGSSSGNAVRPDERDNLRMASDLLGKDVLNRQQQALGEISDLLVDFSGRKPTLALISAKRLLKGDGAFAVALHAFSPGPRNKLLLDANRELFERTPPLTEKTWHEAANGGSHIYRYAETQAANSGRNSGDRLVSSLTP